MRNKVKDLYKDNNRRSRRSERINVSVQLREDRRKDYLDQKRNEAVATPEVILDCSVINGIHAELLSNDRDVVAMGAQNLNQLLLQNPVFNIKEYFDLNIIDPLFLLFDEPNSWEINLCAASTLAIVFTRESGFIRRINSNSYMDKIFKIISDGNPEINENLFNIIALISKHMPPFNEQIINYGFIDIACFVLGSYCTDKTLTHISYTLSMFPSSQFSKGVSAKEVICKTLKLINIFLKINDEVVIENALKTLSHLTNLSKNKVSLVINSGILQVTAQFLDSPTASIVDTAVCVFGNIVSGDDDITQIVIDMGVMEKLFKLLSNGDEQIRKHVLWSFSNVCAGTVSQVEYLYERQMFYQLYNHFLHDTSENKKEALWVISNILFVGQPKHINELLNLSLIKHLCEMLRDSVDKETVLVSLDSITFIFERSGLDYEEIASELKAYEGDDIIYELCEHPSTKINLQSTSIIQQYLNPYDYMDDDNSEFEYAYGNDFM